MCFHFLTKFIPNNFIFILEIALTDTCTTGQPADQCADANAECVGTPLACSCKTAHFVNKDGACDPSKNFSNNSKSNYAKVIIFVNICQYILKHVNICGWMLIL